MAINWGVLVKDLNDAMGMLRTGKKLVINPFIEEELVSFWRIMGNCGLCGANTYFKVKAITQRGEIIRSSLHSDKCPECDGRIHAGLIDHDSVHSHIS